MKSKYKILIVDDDKFLLDMYAVKFAQSGFEVVASLGSMEALAKLKDGFLPDVILTDILMPAMSGFELLSQIKKEGLAKDAKIIILSNMGEKTDLDRGSELKVDGYMIKASMVPSEVVNKVLEVMKGK
ncbi:MAG: response regulator [Candidatus Yonathbacteria bacterium]|nr:response regulator [Candidatus Yonathbacteria bacterium]